MLIDLSRKPIRIISEECPSVVVVRTLALRGKADGIIHQNVEVGYSENHRLKDVPLHPAASVPNGDVEHIETVLPSPQLLVPEVKTRFGLESRPILYAISGYQDQITKLGGTWRVNLIFDATSHESFLMTLLDETNSVALFTVQLKSTDHPHDLLKPIATPLRRYLNRQINQGVDGATGLWGAILDDTLF